MDEGKLTLAELDRQAEKIKGGTPGVVGIIFETDILKDVALKFLNSNEYDPKIKEKDALKDITELMYVELGIDIPQEAKCAKVRDLLARHVLLTEFIASLEDEVPQELTSIKLPDKKVHRDACVDLVRIWRDRRDCRDGYIDHTHRVERELHLMDIDFRLNQIKATETFRTVEDTLQSLVEKALKNDPSEELLGLARDRQTMFWSEAVSEIKSRWVLIDFVGSLLLESDRIKDELKQTYAYPHEMVSAYAEGKHPWCLLDTYHRRMENRYQRIGLGVEPGYESLKMLVAEARHRYTIVGGEIATQFVKVLATSMFDTKGILRQIEVYNKFVSPSLRHGKTAYVLVDAMRFEMARELAESVRGNFTVDIQAALGAVPTITSIGMAALLPRAEKSFEIYADEKGKDIVPSIDGNPLKDRKARMDWLQNYAGFTQDEKQAKVFNLKLYDLLQMSLNAKEQIEDSDLIAVTSQEIDKLCESGDTLGARSAMDSILMHIARAIRTLSQLGCETIVLSADHGYIFGEEIQSDMKTSSPGGQVMALHRRAWVGRGGSKDPSFFRMQKLPFGFNDELEIAVPWGFGVFKVKGGVVAYLHGGMSPQEIVVPVLVFHPKKDIFVAPQRVIWELVPLKERITTRTFTIRIGGKASSLEFKPPRVRVELRERGEVISETFDATYGFDEETKEIQLKTQEKDSLKLNPNEVRLVLVNDPKSKAVTLYLIDVATGVNLKSIKDIEVALAI